MATRVAFTRAPASGAPEGSVARPTTTPVAASWDEAVSASSNEATSAGRTRLARGSRPLAAATQRVGRWLTVDGQTA